MIIFSKSRLDISIDYAHDNIPKFKVMLLANGSIVIPNDENNLVPANTDPFILQFVENPTDTSMKEIPKCTQTIIEKPAGSMLHLSSCTFLFTNTL